MKRQLLLIIFVLLFLSCNTHKRDKFYYREHDKNFWINTYKDEVFYSCIKEGYKNDTITKLMAKKDLFNFADGFDYDILDSAAILGKKIIKNMPPPYVKIDDVDISGKNFISATCLHYYASQELDSIARIEYKKHLKKEKEKF